MKFHHTIISKKNNFFNFFKKKNKNQFRILMYHDIQKNNLLEFRNQLTELKKKWIFINPHDLDKFSETTLPIKGKNLLLTFDDGYKSMLNVKEILQELNINAIFFVISDFVNLTHSDNPKDYIIKNIDSNINMKKDYKNLNWEDLKKLINDGHIIGAHTKSHKKLSKIKNNDFLREEIIESSNEIEKKLNINIKHFAYSYGDIHSFNEISYKIAKSKFKYIFSGIRGNNSNLNFKKCILRRDSIEPNFSLNLIKFFLDGFIDIKYKRDTKKLDKWSDL